MHETSELVVCVCVCLKSLSECYSLLICLIEKDGGGMRQRRWGNGSKRQRQGDALCVDCCCC